MAGLAAIGKVVRIRATPEKQQRKQPTICSASRSAERLNECAQLGRENRNDARVVMNEDQDRTRLGKTRTIWRSCDTWP